MWVCVIIDPYTRKNWRSSGKEIDGLPIRVVKRSERCVFVYLQGYQNITTWLINVLVWNNYNTNQFGHITKLYPIIMLKTPSIKNLTCVHPDSWKPFHIQVYWKFLNNVAISSTNKADIGSISKIPSGNFSTAEPVKKLGNARLFYNTWH